MFDFNLLFNTICASVITYETLIFFILSSNPKFSARYHSLSPNPLYDIFFTVSVQAAKITFTTHRDTSWIRAWVKTFLSLTLSEVLPVILIALIAFCIFFSCRKKKEEVEEKVCGQNESNDLCHR